MCFHVIIFFPASILGTVSIYKTHKIHRFKNKKQENNIVLHKKNFPNLDVHIICEKKKIKKKKTQAKK